MISIQLIKSFAQDFPKFIFTQVPTEVDSFCSKILSRLIYVFAPLLTLVLFYQYVKRLLILNAFKYEEEVRKHYEYIRKLSRQFKALAKRFGILYFRYLPMSHGTTLPQPRKLSLALKEVLFNNNKPGKLPNVFDIT